MSKKCFFICPIGNADSDERNRSDKIMRHILNPICSEKGYEVIRADKINSANKISADIISHLENDELAIADLTGHNPNVFYEIGYRKAQKLPIIHIAEIGTNLPFDTIDDRTIFYNLTDLDLVEEFKQDISKVINNLSKVIDKNLENDTQIDNVSKEQSTVRKEKPYMLLLKEIVDKYSKNNFFRIDTFDEDNIEILLAMGYIDVNKYIDGSINIKPTGEGIKCIINSKTSND